MLEDKLLILRFKYGSSDALSRIYLKYRMYLLKIAAALLHDVNIAEDLVHDIFIRFAQSGSTLKLDGSLKGYLRTCLINDIRNKLRSDQVRNYSELSQTDPIACGRPACEQWIMLTERSAAINFALAQLPFEQREVIVLHLHADMKFRQIAKLLDVPVKTIQSRYRYGLDKLRSIFKSEVEI